MPPMQPGKRAMSEIDDSVRTYIERVAPAKRRRDAERLVELMSRVTGEPARLRGSIIGFGQYHYKYASGREGDAPAAGFSPRKAAMSVYVSDGVAAHIDLLDRLGPHTTGVGCIYIKDLEVIDLAVLEAIVGRSFTTLTAGTYTLRAREGVVPDGAQPGNDDSAG